MLYLNAYNGSGWSGWAQIPGGMTTQHAPAAIVRTLNTIDVFVRSPATARSAGSPGTAPRGRAGRRCRAASTRVPPSSPTRRADVAVRPPRRLTWSTTSTTPAAAPQNGWDGWKLLHPPPPPPPPPPACDLAAGRLTAHAKLVGFGKRPRLAGRARRTDGAPLVSASDHGVTRARRLDAHRHRGRQRLLRAAAAARPDPPDRVKALAPGAGSVACTRAIVRTRAGVTLKTNRRVRPGGTVRFRGRLKGLPVPRRGKLVELQAFDGGRWRTFAQPRSRKNGRYKAAYRLRRTFGPRTFTLPRARAPESGYPYELGYSRKVRVRVR